MMPPSVSGSATDGRRINLPLAKLRLRSFSQEIDAQDWEGEVLVVAMTKLRLDEMGAET
jgi:hypothetical protein